MIDWNKARKALRNFVDDDAAIAVLRWAAAHDYGHRGFLELGGAELIYEAVRSEGRRAMFPMAGGSIKRSAPRKRLNF